MWFDRCFLHLGGIGSLIIWRRLWRQQVRRKHSCLSSKSQEDCNFYFHHSENLKSRILILVQLHHLKSEKNEARLSNTIPTAQITKCVSIRRAKRLQLFRVRIAAYSENNAKDINILCGQTEFFNKANSTYTISTMFQKVRKFYFIYGLK